LRGFGLADAEGMQGTQSMVVKNMGRSPFGSTEMKENFKDSNENNPLL
jgi:hypothetical protein